MSYDIAINVKVEGCGKYAEIAIPEYSSPTYNLGKMFRACMDWDYSTSEKDKNGVYQKCYYPCDFVIERVEHGIRELRTKPKEYKKYNSPNGWGNLQDALMVLEALRLCIYEEAEEIPLNCLYMNW